MRKKGLDKKSVTNRVAQSGDKRSPKELETDREYWRKEFMEHRSELLSYASKLFHGDTSRAESSLQDVFVRLETYTPRGSAVNSPKAFLMTMVRNAINDTNRRPHHESLDDPTSLHLAEDAAIAPDIRKVLENSELLDLLGQEMDPRARQVYELLRQGYLLNEIAEELSMTPEKVQFIKRRITHLLFKKVSGLVGSTSARIAKDQEEITLLKEETRETLARLRAA